MRIGMIGAILLATGCAAAPVNTAPAAGLTTRLVKSMGIRQCEGGVVSPDALVAELRRAGIVPRAATCGADGMMRIAVCGAGTGDIGVFDIAQGDVARAKTIGFMPMPKDGRVVPCR